jgi:hypothetical protein
VADTPTGKPRTRTDIERDIAATRDKLGDTVEALTARLDVKSRARAKLASTIAEARATVQQRPAAVAGIGAGVLVAVIVLIRRSRA